VNHATFVLSTGRCGTQWLADSLSAIWGDAVEVTHEPLHIDYAAREMLGAGDPSHLPAVLAEPILKHMEMIEEALASQRYFECGHPSWSS